MEPGESDPVSFSVSRERVGDIGRGSFSPLLLRSSIIAETRPYIL